jgi:hypothetical protein
MPIRTAQQICIIEIPAMGLGKGVDAIWYPKGTPYPLPERHPAAFYRLVRDLSCDGPLVRWRRPIFWLWPLRMIVGWEHSATDLIGADPDHLAGTEIGVLLTCPAGVR